MEPALLAGLRRVVSLQPAAEKVLVVTQAGPAQALLHHLARSGTPWVNLRVKTPFDLALERVEADLARAGLAVLSPLGGSFLVEELISRHVGADPALRYFAQVPLTPGFPAAVQRSLHDLRLAGLHAAQLRPAAFETPAKGEAMIRLLHLYEAGLAKRALVDRAEIFRRALARLEEGPQFRHRVYLIPGSLAVGRGLVRDFLVQLTRGRAVAIPRDSVVGLETPAAFWSPGPASLAGDGQEPTGDAAAALDGAALGDGERPDVERLPWLYAVAQAPSPAPDGSVGLFRAMGAHNEVRAAFRQVLQRRIPFEDVELVTVDPVAYGRAIYEAAAALDIPCTFAGGLPVSGTRPGQALAAYLQWVREGFPVRPLWRALADGSLAVPDAGDESGMAFARLLRTSGIGWGRDRYLPVLAAREAELDRRETVPAQDGEQKAAGRPRRRDRLRRLRGFLSDLLAQTPAPVDGAIALDGLCRGAVWLLSHCVPRGGALDGAAITRLVETLEEVAALATGALPVAAAVDRLDRALVDLTAGPSLPRPGHVHVSDPAGAGWSGRSETFVLGLDEGRFPGRGLQDPLLLDSERERITPALLLAGERLAQRRYVLAQALAGVRGRLTCSYSSFDPATSRPAFPAGFLLQVHRLAEGDPEADYASLLRRLGPPVGYVPAPGSAVLDRHDLWLGRIAQPDGRLARQEEAVRQAFPGLDQGLRAAAAREGEAFTVYDGHVGAHAERLDPRQNPDLVVSSSRLEMLATCPLRYFFRYVLGVTPPDEVLFDPGRWLDALARGGLLHAIFCAFMQEVRDGGGGRPRPADRDRLLAIAADRIDALRAELPPPSEAVYAAEREEVLRSALLFLQAELTNDDAGVPIHLEWVFGPAGDGTGADRQPPSEPPLLTTASGGQIRVRGQIDRIDHLGDQRYAVWDYKTGSARGFDEEGYLRQGRQLQHALYAAVADQLLRQAGADPAAQVVRSGYLFPTERGEGWRLVRPQERRAELATVLDHLSDLAGRGAFVATDDEKACEWCDYKAACGAEAAVAQGEPKRRSAPELEPWRRLMQHD